MSSALAPWSALATAAALLLVTPRVAAQTTGTNNVTVANVERTVADHDDAFAYYISQEDCLSKDEIEFPLTLANLDGVIALEVWVGEGSANCATVDAREGTSGARCELLEADGDPEQFMEISISSRRITEVGLGIESCVDEGADSDPRAIGIYFMLIRDVATDVPATDYAKWDQTRVDLLGPPPPRSVEVEASDGAAELTYKVPTNSSDTLGYRFYCDDGSFVANESSTSGAGGGAGGGGVGGAGVGGAGDGGDGTGGGGTAGGAAFRGGTVASSGVGGAGGDATGGAGGDGTGGTITGSGGGGFVPLPIAAVGAGGSTTTGSATSQCAGTVMVAGEQPNPAWRSCGSAKGTNGEGTATGIENGTEYAIAVVAYDDLGNVGALSEVVCATPFPVNDFYELYRSSGGQAGGGFCACSVPGGPAGGGLAAVIAGAIGAGAFLRRRKARPVRGVDR